MVFINKVDPLPPVVDSKKIKRAANNKGSTESFEDALDQVMEVDAVEVVLSDEQKKKRDERGGNSKNDKQQDQNKSKLDIEA